MRGALQGRRCRKWPYYSRGPGKRRYRSISALGAERRIGQYRCSRRRVESWERSGTTFEATTSSPVRQ